MQLFFSSHNPGKIKEVKALFSKSHITITTDTQCPEVDEIETTFVANALIKAKQGALHSKLPTLAEDSGLCVPLLGNNPGLRSKRYAGETASSSDNITKLISALKQHHVTQTPAFFVCVMVVLRHPQDPLPSIATGICHGVVRTNAAGTQGFGYDPVFYLPDQLCTLAELDTNAKNRISARAHAAQQLITILANE